MIVWYPLLKIVVVALLSYLAWLPIVKHMEAYKQREKQAATDGTPMDPADSFWPREPKKYLGIVVVLLFIFFTPFRLQSPAQLEQTVRSYDKHMARPPMIEREARQKYTPKDNQTLIEHVLKEEVEK